MAKKQWKHFSIFFFCLCVTACATSKNLSQAEIAQSFPKVNSHLVKTKTTDASLMKVIIEANPPLPERGEYTLEVKYKGKVIPHFIENAVKPEVRVAYFGVPYLEESGKYKVEVLLKSNKSTASIVTQHEFQVSQSNYRTEKLTVDPSRVTPDTKALERITAERDIVNEVYSQVTPKKFWGEAFQNPMKSVVTSPFGNKRLFNGQLKSYHNGIDFRAAVGTPFGAAGSGVVVLARDLYFTGNTLIIDHGFGLFTLYAHLTEFKVKENDVVEKGQTLGLTGSTGRVSGPHLHWSVMLLGERINPISLSESFQGVNPRKLASKSQ